MFEISPFATCWDCKLHFRGAQQMPTLAHKATAAQRGRRWCTSETQHHSHSFSFLFTLFRYKCKSWDSIALGCEPVASKLKRGQLKIRNKSKYLQTGHYCLERHCAHAGPAHLPRELLGRQGQPRETKAVQSHKGRHCRCHRKADTLLNSTGDDPRKPLKKKTIKRSNQRKSKELRVIDWGTHPWALPLSLSLTCFTASKSIQGCQLQIVWCPWRII